MLSILLVDDERAAIEGIRSRVDWKKLKIHKVFTAQDGRLARNVFSENKIDLMLCDIEMPRESGLELIQWVNHTSPQTVCIFLTCHAEFDYAKKALQAGAFEYLLKPVLIDDLEVVLEKAIKKLFEETMKTQYLEYGEKWLSNRYTVQESLWLDILLGTDANNRKKIQKRAEIKKLEIDLDLLYIPILCAVRQGTEQQKNWESADSEYAILNILSEVFETDVCKPPVVLSDNYRNKIILLPVHGGRALNKILIRECCDRSITFIQTYLNCKICFYCGSTCHIEELHAKYKELLLMKKNNVSYDNRVFSIDEEGFGITAEVSIDISAWRELFIDKKTELLYCEAEAMLHGLVQRRQMNLDFLTLFYHAFLQMLYSCLSEKSILAEQLLRNVEPDRISTPESVEDMLLQVRHLLDIAVKQVDLAEQGDTVIDRLQAYIREHIGEELSRDELASYVYLNPNYLSRMFHKKTGKSITTYIMQVRLETVMQLLIRTKLSVSEIARRTGYVNMPYFCKVFKRETEMTPIEYRRNADEIGTSLLDAGNNSDKK